jgi:hypothetical protein
MSPDRQSISVFTLDKLSVASFRHPLCSRQMALECSARALRLMIRVDMQNGTHNMTPIGPLGIGVKQSQIRDKMFFVIGGQLIVAWRQICDVRFIQLL